MPGADLTMKDQVGGNQKRARFQALCQTLRPDLLRFAFWLSRDRALAEDVVQETMLRAWKAQDSLQDEAAFSPICTSCFDALRIWAGPAKRLPEITALSTASPSEMCFFRSRNSHPCTSRLPENAWIAACSPSLLHSTKVQPLKPTVPLPPTFAICWHGPQKALLLMMMG